jgi:hypothetical protein
MTMGFAPSCLSGMVASFGHQSVGANIVDGMRASSY